MTNRVSQEMEMMVSVLWAKSRSNRGFQFQLSILEFFSSQSSTTADKISCGLATTSNRYIMQKVNVYEFLFVFGTKAKLNLSCPIFCLFSLFECRFSRKSFGSGMFFD